MRHDKALFLSLCVTAALSGCMKKQTVQSNVTFKPESNQVIVEQPKIEPGAKIVKAPELPEKLPAAETCVMAGRCLEQNADKMDNDHAMQKDHYHKAQFQFQRALQSDPKCADAIVGIARVNDKIGNHEEAIIGFQQALTLLPQSAEVWFECGMSHNRHGHMSQAVECLRKAATLEPTNNGYNNHLILTLAKAGQFDESLAFLRKRLPEDRACFRVAQMANHFGRRDLCGEYLQAALHVNPDYVEARQLLDVLQAASNGAN